MKEIKFAPTDIVEEYQEQIETILEIIGHAEALVSDRSTIGDFNVVPEVRNTLIRMINSPKDGVNVTEIEDNLELWKLAQALHVTETGHL